MQEFDLQNCKMKNAKLLTKIHILRDHSFIIFGGDWAGGLGCQNHFLKGEGRVFHDGVSPH